MNGKLFVVEGIDSSGKKTQAKKLAERFEKNGEEVKYVNFPRYDTTFGSIVGEYLKGSFGDKNDIQPEIRKLLFAIDRYQFKDEYEKYLESGGYIVANRYTQSNIGYVPKDMKGEEKDKFIEWILDVERRLPTADMVFFLDVSPKIAYNLHETKGTRAYIGGNKRDEYERDVELQKSAYNTYNKMCRTKNNWRKIDCSTDNGLKSEDEIHQKIIYDLNDRFGLNLE